jgi:tetratricopeptide (TPR) repeat protein
MKKWVMMAALALLAQVADAQQQQQPGAKEYLDGEAAFKKGETDAAIAAFEKSVAAGGPVASHYYLGMAYQKKQNLAKAAEHLQKYVAAQPAVADAQYRLAMTLLFLKKNDQAARHFAKVIELKPDIPEPYYYVGQQAYSDQKYDEATRHLQKFLELKRDSPQAAEAHFMLGHLAALRAAQSADPASEKASAKANLEKFLALKPDSPWAGEAHFMLGRMAAEQGGALEEQSGAKPSPEVQAQITEVYNGAKSHLEKFLALRTDSPQAPDAHYILGSLAIRVEDDAAARLHFEKFLQMRPDSPQAEEVKKVLSDLKAAQKK